MTETSLKQIKASRTHSGSEKNTNKLMKTNINQSMNGLKKQLSGLAICCATVFCVGLAPMQAAPDEKLNPETVAAVEKFMVTMKVRESMKPALAGVKKMQDAMIEQQQISDEQKAATRKLIAASMGEIEEMMSWDSIGPVFVRAYAKVFTTEEINGLIKLFETPAGQVFVNKQIALQQATMKEMQTIMMEIMPKIQAKTKEAIEKALEEDAQNK